MSLTNENLNKIDAGLSPQFTINSFVGLWGVFRARRIAASRRSAISLGMSTSLSDKDFMNLLPFCAHDHCYIVGRQLGALCDLLQREIALLIKRQKHVARS